jgi:hypothetical protein
MSYVKIQDWSSLPGTDAEVWRNSILLATGTIDAVTEDSSIAWLFSHSTGERFLVERNNGIELRISPDQFIRRIPHSNRPVQQDKIAH